jgi:hypothetical protein
LAKATKPSAHSRRPSSIGIVSVAPGLPSSLARSADGGWSRNALASLPIASLAIG